MADEKAYESQPKAPLASPPPDSSQPAESAREQAPVAVEYPSADGELRGADEWQMSAMADMFSGLRIHFGSRKDIAVSTDLLIYFEEGNPQRKVAPDVFVARGVPNHMRDNYKIWEEGKQPDFVLEVASSWMALYNADGKKALYERLQVQEYFLYDPHGGLHWPRLQGYELAGGKYRPLPSRPLENDGLALASSVLGLELRFDQGRLRLWDPAARVYLLEGHEVQMPCPADPRFMRRLRRAQARIAARERRAAADRARTRELDRQAAHDQAQREELVRQTLERRRRDSQDNVRLWRLDMLSVWIPLVDVLESLRTWWKK